MIRKHLLLALLFLIAIAISRGRGRKGRRNGKKQFQINRMNQLNQQRIDNINSEKLIDATQKNSAVKETRIKNQPNIDKYAKLRALCAGYSKCHTCLDDTKQSDCVWNSADGGSCMAGKVAPMVNTILFELETCPGMKKAAGKKFPFNPTFSSHFDNRNQLPGGWTRFRALNKNDRQIWQRAKDNEGTEYHMQLNTLGAPVRVATQVVAGTKYLFKFDDLTVITVLNQPWSDKCEITSELNNYWSDAEGRFVYNYHGYNTHLIDFEIHTCTSSTCNKYQTDDNELPKGKVTVPINKFFIFPQETRVSGDKTAPEVYYMLANRKSITLYRFSQTMTNPSKQTFKNGVAFNSKALSSNLGHTGKGKWYRATWRNNGSHRTLSQEKVNKLDTFLNQHTFRQAYDEARNNYRDVRKRGYYHNDTDAYRHNYYRNDYFKEQREQERKQFQAQDDSVKGGDLNFLFGGDEFELETAEKNKTPTGLDAVTDEDRGEQQPEPVTVTDTKPKAESRAKKSKLSGGAIAGIVISCVAFLALLGGLAYWLHNKKNLDETTTQV